MIGKIILDFNQVDSKISLRSQGSKGKDGKLWENKKYLRGKRWVKVQTGGFIRGENYLDLT